MGQTTSGGRLRHVRTHNRIVQLASSSPNFKTAREIPKKCLCFKLLAASHMIFQRSFHLFSCFCLSACCFCDFFPLLFYSSGHLVCWLHHGRNDQRQNALQRERLYLLCHWLRSTGSSLRAVITQVSHTGTKVEGNTLCNQVLLLCFKNADSNKSR